MISEYDVQVLKKSLQEIGVDDPHDLEQHIVQTNTRRWWQQAHTARTDHHQRYGRGYCPLCTIQVTFNFTS